jgi:hypothetical protein
LATGSLDGAGPEPAFFLEAVLDFAVLCFFPGLFVAFFGVRLVLALAVFFLAGRFFFAIDPSPPSAHALIE